MIKKKIKKRISIYLAKKGIKNPFRLTTALIDAIIKGNPNVDELKELQKYNIIDYHWDVCPCGDTDCVGYIKITITDECIKCLIHDLRKCK